MGVAMFLGIPYGLFEGRQTASGAAILRAAATTASAQPAQLAAYRYTELVERETYAVSRGPQQASVTLEQPSEQWIDREGTGHQILRPSRIVERSGDATLQATLPRGLQAPGDEPYPSPGSAGRPIPLDSLPTDPGALLEMLTASYRDGRISADGSQPTPSWERYQITTVILQLLSDANATPAQRGALFEALARMDGVTGLGTVTDPLGRAGQGVAIETSAADPLPGARFTVIVDPKTSALLSWTVTNDAPSRDEPALTARTHIVIRQGNVDQAEARP